MSGVHTSRTRTAARASVAAVVLLTACSPQAPSAPEVGSTATPSTDAAADLTDRLLTVDEFPVTGWRESDTLPLPLPEEEEPPAAASATAFCADADSHLVYEGTELAEATGVMRVFHTDTGYLTQMLLDDESGEVADTLQNRVQSCIDTGPTAADPSTARGWTRAAPTVDGVFAAQIGALDATAGPTDLTVIGIARHDGTTLITLGDLQGASPTPEELVRITGSMHDELTR